jgi:hypothetical protein
MLKALRHSYAGSALPASGLLVQFPARCPAGC